jgi:formylglycine-generating enzyme required for sulfatase activity
MAGNVWEWTDTLYIANLDDVALTSVDDEDTLADEMADRDLVEMAAEDMQPRDEFDKRIVDGLNHPRRSIDPDHSLPIRDETLPHVLRGGSWGDQRTRVRCAARHFDSPSIADWLYGFRVVVSCPEG